MSGRLAASSVTASYSPAGSRWPVAANSCWSAACWPMSQAGRAEVDEPELPGPQDQHVAGVRVGVEGALEEDLPVSDLMKFAWHGESAMIAPGRVPGLHEEE